MERNTKIIKLLKTLTSIDENCSDTNLDKSYDFFEDEIEIDTSEFDENDELTDRQNEVEKSDAESEKEIEKSESECEK